MNQSLRRSVRTFNRSIFEPRDVQELVPNDHMIRSYNSYQSNKQENFNMLNSLQRTNRNGFNQLNNSNNQNNLNFSIGGLFSGFGGNNFNSDNFLNQNSSDINSYLEPGGTLMNNLKSIKKVKDQKEDMKSIFENKG